MMRVVIGQGIRVSLPPADEGARMGNRGERRVR